jgi:hypothetical protein
MSQSRTYRIRTDKDVQFTGALVTNATENEDIVVGFAEAELHLTLTAITVVSDQNLAWELDFWDSSLFGSSSNMDADGFIGFWAFNATDAVRVAGAGSYRYYIDGLQIPLTDADKTATLHVGLVNRSATSKIAGASGEIVVTFHVEGQQVGGA